MIGRFTRGRSSVGLKLIATGSTIPQTGRTTGATNPCLPASAKTPREAGASRPTPGRTATAKTGGLELRKVVPERGPIPQRQCKAREFLPLGGLFRPPRTVGCTARVYEKVRRAAGLRWARRPAQLLRRAQRQRPPRRGQGTHQSAIPGESNLDGPLFWAILRRARIHRARTGTRQSS